MASRPAPLSRVREGRKRLGRQWQRKQEWETAEGVPRGAGGGGGAPWHWGKPITEYYHSAVKNDKLYCTLCYYYPTRSYSVFRHQFRKVFWSRLKYSSNQQNTQLNLRKWLFLTELNGRKACRKTSSLIAKDVCQNWSRMRYLRTSWQTHGLLNPKVIAPQLLTSDAWVKHIMFLTSPSWFCFLPMKTKV